MAPCAWGSDRLECRRRWQTTKPELVLCECSSRAWEGPSTSHCTQPSPPINELLPSAKMSNGAPAESGAKHSFICFGQFSFSKFCLIFSRSFFKHQSTGLNLDFVCQNCLNLDSCSRLKAWDWVDKFSLLSQNSWLKARNFCPQSWKWLLVGHYGQVAV